MYLQKVEIDDFKCIDHLEFEPTKINLIVGRNNTGKTSLLDAIRIPHDARVVDAYNNLQHMIFSGKESAKIRCKFDSTETNAEIRQSNEKTFPLEFKKKIFEGLEVYFKNEKRDLTATIKEKIGLILEDKSSKDLMKSLQTKSIGISVNDDNRVYSPFEKKFTILEKIETLAEKIFKAVSKEKNNASKIEDPHFSLTLPLIISLQGPRQSEMTDQIIFIDCLEMPEKKDIDEKDAIRIKEIEDFIRSKNIIEGLVKFDLDYLIFDHNGKKESIPFEFMGGGFQAMIGILWGLSSPNSTNKIILMEEPDRGMHPGFISQLMKMIIQFSRERKMQFFITTHNTDFIDMFFDKDMDAGMKKYLEKNLSIFRMSIKKKHVIPEYLPYKEAVEYRDKLFSDLRGI